MQIPFIENRGQVESEDVSFYAKTFDGTLFVEKNGTLTYSLSFEDKEGIVIKEVFSGYDAKKTCKLKENKPDYNHFSNYGKKILHTNLLKIIK